MTTKQSPSALVLLLTVDIGTTSIKGMVWSITDQHEPVAITRSISSLPSPSITVADAPQQFAIQVEVMVRKLFTFIEYQSCVCYLALSCFAMSLLGIDKDGKPVTPLITYASALPLPPPTSHITIPPPAERVGVPDPMHSSYALSHLTYWLTLSPSIHKFTTLSSFCLSYLMNKTMTNISLSEACWWGILEQDHVDPNMCNWAQELPQPIHHVLPVVCLDGPLVEDDVFVKFPRISKAFACADGAAAQLGSTPLGNVGVTIGTSSAARIAIERSQLMTMDMSPVRMGCFTYRITRNLSLVGGALNDGGNVLDFAIRVLALRDLPIAMIETPPSIMVLPFFTPGGERATGWRGNVMPGAIVGLRDSHSARDIQHAMIVGACLRLRDVINRLKRVVAVQQKEVNRVWASGNALVKNQLWSSTLAASLNCQVVMMRPPHDDGLEGLETLVGLMILVTGWPLPDNARVLSSAPVAKVASAYDDAFEKQMQLMKIFAGSRL